VESSLDKTTGEMFELLACLDEEMPACARRSGRREADGDPLAGVASPDVQTRVARAAVDGQAVQVGVKSGEDRVLLTIFGEIGGSRGKQMGST
jgi:hypothetical protein